jgi:ubiquinone/menaquinone biosynthesis C-methylase UbiE
VIYREAMLPRGDPRTYFNEVAEDYDRHRPAYPELLIDRACEAAQIGAGAPVLEIGCGSGQLTRSLVARGLRVTAVEPGEQLITRARDHLEGQADVRFVHARLEDAVLPRARYSAVFSATAIHWVDPEVSWRKAADVLMDGGTLALISYFGLDDPRTADDEQALRAAVTAVVPELADDWPTYHALEGILEGVAARRENVSEVYAWLAGHAIARGYAAALFDEAQFVARPACLEHTADEINALLRTMSFWGRLTSEQRDALTAENEALYRRLGRPIRSSTVACLVTARRRRRS